MAQGEVGFTTRGRVAKKFEFPLLPKGDYGMKLDTSALDVAKKAGDPGALPYLSGLKLVIGADMNDVPFESPRMLFHSLFTRITPTEKGNISFDDMKGPLGIAQALGQEVDVPPQAVKSYPEIDRDTKEATGRTIQLVDPLWLKGWLKQFDGQTIRGHVKTRSQKDQDKKNEVAYFIGVEGTNDDAFGGADEASADAFAADAEGDGMGAEADQEVFAEEEQSAPVQTKPSNNGVRPHTTVKPSIAAQANRKPNKPAGRSARR